jgi:2-polyprenyl-3-methyl-5-hydroxy-6-metoxy-1,4-benzoquinol methylase
MTAANSTDHYILRGGREGRERLRLLARVMNPASIALLDRVGLRPGMHCLDFGCGGGDMTIEIARRAGPSGRVVGWDFDPVKIALADAEIRAQGVERISFQQIDIRNVTVRPEFDLVYSRFLLSHLSDSPRAIATMKQALRPGGLLVLEDVDFSGHFAHPRSAALDRYVELYTLAARQAGADPTIGPRLPELLSDTEFTGIGMQIVQAAAFEGEVKLVNPITMESIAPAIIERGFATVDEVRQIIFDLHADARDRRRVVSAARVVQAWGRRAASQDRPE